MKHNYQNLQIWEQGPEIAKDVYDYGEGLPDREKRMLIAFRRRLFVK